MPAKQTKLDVMFPNRDIKLSDGSIATIHPLSLEDLPKVIRVLAKILKLASDLRKTQDESPGVDTFRYADLVVLAGEEVVQLFPYCMDRDPKEITFVDAPEVIETILEQNLTEAALGKWTALIQKLAGKLGVDITEIVDQGKQALKKELPT